MKRILTLITIILAACGPIDYGMTAPTAGSARLLTTGETPEPPEEENAAGAVFEIPTIESRMCATVTADEALHLRAAPNEKATHIEYLTAGQVVTVLDLGPWWKIKTEAGQVGYANARYLAEEKCR